MASMAGVPTAATAAAAWQGVPQPQLPATAAAAAAAGQMATLQQPPSVVGAYPVQQFQVSSPIPSSARLSLSILSSFYSSTVAMSFHTLSLDLATYHL